MKSWRQIIIDNYPHPEELKTSPDWEPKGERTKEQEVRLQVYYVLFEYGRVDYIKKKVTMTHYHGGFKQEHLDVAAQALWVEVEQETAKLLTAIKEAMTKLQTLQFAPATVVMPESYQDIYAHSHILGFRIIRATGHADDGLIRVFSEDRGGGRWVTLPIEP